MEMIQSHLGPFGTAAASFFTLFGEEIVIIAILGFLYWCVDKKAAQFIGTNIMVGLAANLMIKNLFLRRRPYFDHPQIKCLKAPDGSADIYDISAQGYSFPSGHAMNSAVCYGTGAMLIKKRSIRILTAVLPLLIGVSRVVLGVHYPTDVLAGWILGAAVLLLVSYLQRSVKNRDLFHLLLFICALPGILWCRTDSYYTVLGAMAGFFLSIPFEEKYVRFENTKNPLTAAVRLTAGLAVYFGANVLLKMPFSESFLNSASYGEFAVRTVRYMIITFLMLAVYPMLFGKRKNS